jgi:hypothetical protein
VGDDRVDLGQERAHRLGGAATHEVHQRVTNSGRSTYISGVKHHGKIPWITTSATVGSVDASVRHCSTTIFR